MEVLVRCCLVSGDSDELDDFSPEGVNPFEEPGESVGR